MYILLNNSFLSNIFSNFHFGVFGVNECKTNDDTWYCNLSRFFSAVMMILILLAILGFIFYLIQIYVLPNFKKGGKFIKRR